MKLYEIISTDEGWKSGLAAAGLGTALTFGGLGTDKSKYLDPPAHPPRVLSDLEILKQAAVNAGIRGTELAHFISQAAHETLDFSRMKEMGSDKYIIKKYDIRYNPRKAKILGNVSPGDGIKYKGRGFLQITGRYNYRKAGEALGLPLETRPEMLEDPKIAAKAAVWYWTTRVQPKISSSSTVANVTKKINPGMRGLNARQQKFTQYKDVADTPH